MRYDDPLQVIGNTPLVRLRALPRPGSGQVLCKLEGQNPAGSVKDRPALAMIAGAEARGEIRPGDTLIEATSGNTGIALAMIAAIKGYRMVLIMPEDMSAERQAAMRAYGAEIVLASAEGGMEECRDLAQDMAREGRGRVLDQFANPDNFRAHEEGTGPEIWRDTGGGVTHLVSSMGTTGTIVGTGRHLKRVAPSVRVVGVQPAGADKIPGIRRWPAAYMPRIYDPSVVDELVDVTRAEAERTTRDLAAREGIFAGVSAGGATRVALDLAAGEPNAVVVVIVPDRGDRYLSTGIFEAR